MPVLFFVGIMGLFWVGLSGVSKTTEDESLNSTRQAIVRSAVNCYAMEGEYPTGIAYLEENYGLTVNRDKYLIDYDCFASNVMPSIQVLPINAEEPTPGEAVIIDE